MRNRNLWVIGIAVILIAVIGILAAVIPEKRVLSSDAPTLTAAPSPTAAPTPTIVPTAEKTAAPTTSPSSEPSATSEPAKAYLLVTVKGTLYEPIPLYSEGTYGIRQPDTGAENVIHVTEDSIYMESSSCDNQDCVLQGTVSLDNMAERVLGNMIICLPNQVTLELHTQESLVSLLMQE